MAQPKIYRSDLPPTPVIQESIFTYIMETTFHQYDPTEVAFVDAGSEGIKMSREKVKDLALKLGYGLRNHVFLPSSRGSVEVMTKLDRGDMVMFLSGNTMSWPALTYG